MLIELKGVRQIEDEPTRRWFSDSYFDLIIWHDEVTLLGFELSYNKERDQKVFAWHKVRGFSHSAIDDGEGRPGRYKMSPIAVPDGVFNKDNIINKFQAASENLPPKITRYVLLKMKEYKL